MFGEWFGLAKNSGMPIPEAMTLSTVTESGKPAARTVLLKDYSENGFTFFTNYESRKSRELSHAPTACLLFHWISLEKQIRIDGTVEKVDRKTSEDYFHTRPRESQIGAWASRQSSVIPDREYLINEFKKFEKLYEGKDIPLPPYWGGWLVKPLSFEFWQGQPGRLHDRHYYEMQNNSWIIKRLSP